MVKLTNLELIQVNYENDNKKAVLVFLDEERGEIREVTFNKQIFEDGKFIDSDEKAEKVESWCTEIFGVPFNSLGTAVGVRKDVYAYDTFNSLFQVQQVTKFEDDMVGQILQAEVKEVIVDNIGIKIRFEFEGNIYESKMGYSDYIEAQKKWYVNPNKKAKQFAKFEEKFGVPVEKKDDLIGETVMVEVKKAMGKFIFPEIKPFPKKKAKK
ncbi:MAG: hypothetical protein K0M69_17955 [Youngiibacter sp.]|nr:hypothetical protein [Youngiibacter sp.]